MVALVKLSPSLDSWSDGRKNWLVNRMTDIREELFRIKSALESSTKPKELPICELPSVTTPICKPKPLFGAEGLDAKPLNVTAPVFIPSAGSTSPCGGGSGDAVTEGSG